MRKVWMMAALVLVVFISACSSNGGSNSPTNAPESTKKPSSEATEKTEKMYVPVISKGFQHQFWQAVKIGAEKAAAELNVDITFEGDQNKLFSFF